MANRLNDAAIDITSWRREVEEQEEEGGTGKRMNGLRVHDGGGCRSIELHAVQSHLPAAGVGKSLGGGERVSLPGEHLYDPPM